MADIKSGEDLRRWLEARPEKTRRADAVAIAARAALRVLPLVWNDRLYLQQIPTTLAFFRVAALLRVAAVYPARWPAVVNGASAAIRRAEEARGYLAKAPVTADAIVRAGPSAQAASSSIFALQAVTATGADIVGFASNTAVTSAGSLGDVWSTIEADASAIERRVSPKVVAEKAFWLLEVSPNGYQYLADARDVTRSWYSMRGSLHEKGADWQVWTSWYDAILAGHPPYPRIRGKVREDLECAIAALPDELWRDPAKVNAEIRRLIDEAHAKQAAEDLAKPDEATGIDNGKLGHEFSDLPAEGTLPKPIAGAQPFTITPDGIIGTASPSPDDCLTDTTDVRGAYGDCRDKALELHALGANSLGVRLYGKVAAFISRAPAEFEQAVERDLWSSGNSLRTILSAHDQVKGERDPHWSRLDAGVAESLRDLVETFNDLAFVDSQLRARDARRAGPAEIEEAKEEIAAIAPMVAEAANDRKLTTVEAGEELREQQRNADEAGDDVPGRLAVEHNRDTKRNFVTSLICACYRSMKQLPAHARGEGGFASRQIFEGAYKAIGAGGVAALPVAAAGAYYLRWEIIDFLVANSDLLRSYSALAFEHSPGAIRMIEWLEANVKAGASNNNRKS